MGQKVDVYKVFSKYYDIIPCQRGWAEWVGQEGRRVPSQESVDSFSL